MKVSFNGVEYSIRWRYNKIPVMYGENIGKMILDATTCRVSRIDPKISSGPNRYLELVQASICQKFGDISNRNFARKLSLSRAIKNLDKDMRTAFMKAFLAECRGPWKKKAIMVTASV